MPGAESETSDDATRAGSVWTGGGGGGDTAMIGDYLCPSCRKVVFERHGGIYKCLVCGKPWAKAQLVKQTSEGGDVPAEARR